MSVLEKTKPSAPPKAVPRKALAINVEYEDKAKTLLREAMTKEDLDYDGLAKRLNEIGVDITGRGLANKISRGGFPASFLLQCLDVIKANTLDPQLNE